MTRRITSRSSLDNLKREAKRWLRALQQNIGDARARFERALENAPGVPTLRDVQHALAREHGLSGWAALKAALSGSERGARLREELVSRFIDNACPDHHVRGRADHVRALHTAMRLIDRYPDIAHASFYTDIICGDLAAVESALASQSDLATRKSSEPSPDQSHSGGEGDLVYRDLGAKGWTPLLYLCFTRLPLAASNDNALAMARALLDRGADPKAFFKAGGSEYTPMVGAIGEGEEDRPPHPHRDALVRLLLERGANPYDIQVVYNIGFHGRVQWFLELIYDHAVQHGRKADWDDPEWSMISMGGYGSGARWHLEVAIKHNDAQLAEWCLAHGASPNSPAKRDTRFPQHSLYEEAVRRGCTEIAELLLRYGAQRTEIALSGVEAFAAAAFRLDRAEARALLEQDPAYLRAPEPMLAAAKRDRADVVEFLLDLGVSPDVENDKKERPLHVAAYDNALRVARLLIARGADVDARESNWGNSPLGCAGYYRHAEMIDLISATSHDVWELTYLGKLDRLRAVLREYPALAKSAGGGHTLLMWLPTQDEGLAMETARLLLAYGADPSPRNNEGMTAAERAERNGMFELAELLARAAAGPASRPTLDAYERMAVHLLEAYDTGTPEAMQRHWHDTWHQRTWQAMRSYVQADLGKRVEPGGEDVTITMDDARLLVALDHGFASWQSLADYLAKLPAGTKAIARSLVRVLSDPREGDASDSAPAPGEDEDTVVAATRDWDEAFALLLERRLPGLDANGQMTDDALERISHLEHITTLRIGGSKALTDDGVRWLARMPQLRHLDLSGTQVTDRGLEVLRQLPALELLSLAGTRVTDGGAAALATCERVERINLAGTDTGDGVIAALAGKEKLRHFKSGARVTDAGLPLLEGFPVFKTWHGGDGGFALLSPDAEPNSLMLRGSFTDAGFATLAGLDGLFGLNVDDRNLVITAAGLAPLVNLPHLGFLAFDATDDAMPFIAAMPHLKFLMCQDTSAGDDGFAALGRSQSIEYIWGRRCHNLRDRGFRALAGMPALRSLSVSCKNVSDAAIASLPDFASLRELMPMDIPDAGYRHIGRCERLEALILMYCRDTSDAATEHITGLRNLRKYFASYTLITDRTPELLSGIPSLEQVQFSACAGLTNAGIVSLARLPRFRELQVDGMRNVTADIASAFPERVRVRHSP